MDVVRLKADLLANVALSDRQVRDKLRYIKSSMMVQSSSSTNQSASHFDSSEKEPVSFGASSAANDEELMLMVSDSEFEVEEKRRDRVVFALHE